MLTQILIATGLVVVTVVIHAIGFAVLIRALVRSHALAKSGFLPVTALVIVLTCCLMLIHSLEIAVWGLFYYLQGCMPDPESAFYFSAVTYSMGSDGGLALPSQLRLLAPLEALTAILMCGISTGLFFAIVNQWIDHWIQRKRAADQQLGNTGAPSDLSKA